ncbi:MAG: T9SS type A sorting domain-containing protein [Candidatus Cloacimonetes bacterium]|nr:T9SS type A sorting domain-containing protein [Candidatus Cloacimonadota bacterium]
MKRMFLLMLLISFALSLFAGHRAVQNKLVTSQEISKANRPNRAEPSVTINAGSITISNGAELNIASPGDLYVNTDDGLSAIDTGTVNNGTDNFTGPEGTNDQLTIASTSNMGAITVTNYSGVQHPNAPNAIDRYWDIHPTTDGICTITFRVRNSDVSTVTTLTDLRVYEYDSGLTKWTKLKDDSPSVTSGTTFTSLVFSNIDLTGAKSSNIITLNEYNEDPLPVSLSTFMATFEEGISQLAWTTQSEFDNSGWNLYRAISDNFGQSNKINIDLIEGAGTTSEPTNYIFTDNYEFENGSDYWYWLESVDYAGTTTVHGPIILSVPLPENPNPPDLPDNYGLFQNYPNPFNPITWISFYLKENDNVKLAVYNLKGQKIKTLFEGEITNQQVYHFTWDGKDSFGKDASSGVYFYKLKTQTKEHVRKMMLTK